MIVHQFQYLHDFPSIQNSCHSFINVTVYHDVALLSSSVMILHKFALFVPFCLSSFSSYFTVTFLPTFVSLYLYWNEFEIILLPPQPNLKLCCVYSCVQQLEGVPNLSTTMETDVLSFVNFCSPPALIPPVLALVSLLFSLSKRNA